MKSPQRTRDLRQVNTQVLLRHLYFHGPMSRLGLSNQTNLSLGTVSNVIGGLLQSGILIQKGLEESGGGRPRTIFEINPKYGYLIGVDMEETYVLTELFDLTRHKLGALRENILAEEDPIKQYIRIISDSATKLIVNAGIPRNKVLGMGIGVPGIVGHNGCISVAAPMWNWEPVALLEMIERQVQLPVFIDNGAKAMALAESWYGVGRGVQDMVVILIRRGVGVGIITKGSLYRGATNSAGEWGHTKTALAGRPCRCGSRGCMEAYVGAPGIIATLHETAHQPKPDLPEDTLLSLTELVQAYRNGDPLATQVMQSTTQYLGAGIANLVNLFNPELIVIGGWVGLLVGDAILDKLIRVVKEYALPISTQHLRIGLCQFGEDSVCTGAAILLLEEILSLNPEFSPREIVTGQPDLSFAGQKIINASFSALH